MRHALLLSVAVVATVRADVTPKQGTRKAAAAATPAPLLVVLHGNNESARVRGAKWREAIKRRGWKLLALDCPRDLGCNAQGQWYAWDQPADWIFERVHELAAKTPIDTSRIYLAGWSGGATYIGKRMPEWAQLFAGVVIHGGGVPPQTEACPDPPLPAYFLVGDRNPMFGSMRGLRAYMDRCEQTVKWDQLPGANHAREDAALTRKKAEAILRWLEQHKRTEDDLG